MARAMLGATGTGHTYEPRYASSSSWERTSIDRHTDTYVDGRYAGRDTVRDTELSYVTRYHADGVETYTHQTVELHFEDPENRQMTVRSPHWGGRGDLIYVATYPGVSTTIWEVYSPKNQKWHVIHEDQVKTMRWEIPLVVGFVAFFVQTVVLGLPASRYPALYAGGACFAIMAGYRQWRSIMIGVAHRKAVIKVRNLIAKDDPAEITEKISRRIRGY